MTGASIGKVTLIVSLALNAFLLGGIATHAWSHRQPGQERHVLHERSRLQGGPGERWSGRGPMEAKLLRDVMRALGGPENPHVREAMASGREKMAAHHQRMQSAQEAVRQALASEPYDRARLTAALVDLRRAAALGQEQAQETLVHLAGQLSPEQRKALRSSVPEAPPRRRTRH